MDGVRAYWNGKNLWSRHSKKIGCPGWFTANFPEGVALDGELWMGRLRFEGVLAVINSSGIEHSGWKDLEYVIFDLPASKKPFENRLEEMWSIPMPSHVKVVEYVQCNGNNHLIEFLHKTVNQGGEGLMLMKPGSSYLNQRTDTILKVKVRLFYHLHLNKIIRWKKIAKFN